jgi:DNA modification methylase
MEVRNRIKELRWVRASELVPHGRNWRVHTPQQTAALKGLLAEIGYADALIGRILPDGKIGLIDGHLRKSATPKIEVPVLIVDLNDEEADKLLLTLDPSMAEADQQKIMALLETVRTDSQAVASLLERIAGEAAWQAMNDPTKVVDVTAQLDKAAELQAKWGTAAGQAWQAGPNRLICGDCREKGVVGLLWRHGGPKLRLLWTDPPYGVDYASKNAYLNRTDRGNRIQRPIENDRLTPEQTGALFQAALAAAIPHCASGACCYATVPSGRLLVHFIQTFDASGFEFRHLLVWIKQHFVIGMDDYHYRHEPILYGWLPDGAHYFCGDRCQDSVFEFDKPQVSDLHPTCKPSELIAPMIANSSRAGEIIYDPFLGSGSTLVAAHQLGRVGYGVEISPEYLAVALERLSMLGLEPSLVDG